MPRTSSAEQTPRLAKPDRAPTRAMWRRLTLATIVLTVLLGGGLLGGFAAVTRGLSSRALANRDLAAAQRWLTWSKRLAHNDPQTELLEARLARREGRLDDVRRHLLLARGLGASVDTLEREQWLAQAQAGQMRDAEPQLARLLTDPRGDGAEICEAYVTGYLLTYQLNRAQPLIDAWIADFPQDPQPHLIRARLLLLEKKSVASEAEYKRALDLMPDCTEAMQGLADALAMHHRPADALEWYLRVPSGAREAVTSQVGAANCLATLGRASEAREILSELLQAHPQQPLVSRNLGQLELEAGNYERAVTLLRGSLAQQPENDETLYALAAALRGTGHAEEARGLSLKVEQIRKTDAEINRLLAIVAQDPENADARYEIGLQHLNNGMQKEALLWLNSVLRFDPNHAPAREAIKRYENR